MKNTTIKIILIFVLTISNLLSQGIEIKLVIDKQNKTSFYRENEPLVDKGTYNIEISQNEQIKFILENTSQRKPIIKFITNKDQLPIDPEIFKLTNHIETDEKQILNYMGKSLQLPDKFEIILMAEGEVDANEIHFIIKYKEKVMNNSGSGIAPIQLMTQAKDADQKDTNKKFIPGCAVTDAIALNTKKALTKQELIQLLSHYFPTASDETAFINETKNNDFLKQINFTQLFDDARSVDDKAKSQSEGSSLLSNLSFSSIGGLDVTNIADGFAKFLVKRTKEELNIAFFEKLKEDLENPRFKDLQTLFPKTYSLLLTLGKDIYNYQRYLQNLREAFKGDIDDLVKNLPSVIQNHPDFFIKNKELAAALNSACYVATELQNQTHPGDILANYPIAYLEKFTNQYPVATMRTLQLINMSMRKVSDKENKNDFWVDMNQVRNMVNDRKTFKIYLGLLLQETKNNFGDISYSTASKISVVSVLEKIAGTYDKTYNDYEAYKQYILQFAQKTHALNTMIRSYRDLPLNDSISFELYAKYFTSTVDLIEYATKASELPHIKNTQSGSLHEILKPYFDITYKTVDLSLDINKKNYSSAINNAVNIYDRIKSRKEINDIEIENAFSITEYKKNKTLNAENNKELKKLEANDSRTDAEEINYLNLKKSVTDFNGMKLKYNDDKEKNKKQLDSLNQVINKLAKYGALFSTVAQAKNSDEVANAIETFALPTGSYRIKKESAWNVSVNAYLGFYGGYESIKPFQYKKDETVSSFGITAPIGIALSKGIPEISSSVTIFASIIDLGAITAFRFENDTTKSISKIQLRDIISPGVFISLGLPKMPISINIGYQMTTLLKSVGTTENTFEPRFSRISLGICVDIPVFNLYTKTY